METLPNDALVLRSPSTFPPRTGSCMQHTPLGYYTNTDTFICWYIYNYTLLSALYYTKDLCNIYLVVVAGNGA